MSAFQPGDLIGGRYRLIRMIGAGAMGTVWHARNESTDRDFALKLMMPDAAKNPVALQRFFQEAKASGRLRHRCIVEVYDLGRIEGGAADGTPYLVMELLEGEPLDSLLRRRGTLPAGTALRIVRDVALALDVAHKQRIVHRDLKPANVYLHQTLEGTLVPKILDFGISKLVGPANFDPVATGAGTVLGSPAYMSPEQAGGEADVDGRSDVWSLGVILYKLLCGSVPFSAPSYNALLMAIARDAHVPLSARVADVPPEVEAIVDRCLEKSRADRFESAKALADELDRVIDAHGALPHESLRALVVAPVELPVDDARTIDTRAERSPRTLSVTEAEPPGATQEASHTRTLAKTTLEHDVAPDLRPSGRARLAAFVAAATAAAAIALFAAGRARDAAPSEASPAAPQMVAASPATSASSTASSASAPPIESVAPPEPPKTTPEPPKTPVPATSKPAAPGKGKPKPPKSKTTAKPVHEGVTAPGL